MNASGVELPQKSSTGKVYLRLCHPDRLMTRSLLTDLRESCRRKLNQRQDGFINSTDFLQFERRLWPRKDRVL
jgi:hypothetical protein